MMLLSLVLALSTSASEPALGDAKVVAVQELSVSFPSEIGSAIKPYLDCLVAAVNVGIGEGMKSDGNAMRAISAKSRETCLPVRKSAQSDAEKILEQYPNRSPEQRNAMIESAFTSAESLSENMADMMDQYDASAEASGKNNAPNN